MIKFEDMPINNIQWLDVDLLEANGWNPNHVLAPEMKLIKTSLMATGWLQPILVSREVGEDGEVTYQIIDGYHRSTLCKTDADVRAMTGGRVPCAVLNLTIAERMMLTVRINRAKGTHQAFRMHELVRALVIDHAVPIATVCKSIGATEHEVNTLMMENVFMKLDTANHAYTEAWRPKKRGEA